MPISNGFETCSKIVDLFNERREVAFYKPILLGLQEGELTQQARDNALESGFDTVMASPIDISNVDSEIIPLINDRERAIQNSYNRAMNVEDLKPLCFRKSYYLVDITQVIKDKFSIWKTIFLTIRIYPNFRF